MLQLEDSNTVSSDVKQSFVEVIAAVERLPEVHRTVILLVAVEGLTCSEAALVLGVPVETVISRLTRACQALSRDIESTCSIASQAKSALIALQSINVDGLSSA